MIRSGKLTHVITIESAATTVNAAGTPSQSWSVLATLRAEKLEQSAEEFLRNPGETTVETLIFRTRFFNGLTDEDRVSFNGLPFDIQKVVTIGRDRGLEIHCERIEP